eukprot:4197154-Amphidinium_carterae.1
MQSIAKLSKAGHGQKDIGGQNSWQNCLNSMYTECWSRLRIHIRLHTFRASWVPRPHPSSSYCLWHGCAT